MTETRSKVWAGVLLATYTVLVVNHDTLDFVPRWAVGLTFATIVLATCLAMCRMAPQMTLTALATVLSTLTAVALVIPLILSVTATQARYDEYVAILSQFASAFTRPSALQSALIVMLFTTTVLYLSVYLYLDDDGNERKGSFPICILTASLFVGIFTRFMVHVYDPDITPLTLYGLFDRIVVCVLAVTMVNTVSGGIRASSNEPARWAMQLLSGSYPKPNPKDVT